MVDGGSFNLVFVNIDNMTLDKNHKCYRKSRFFGDYLDHNFKYIDRKKRICIVCGEKQIYFGMSLHGGFEDWRPKI